MAESMYVILPETISHNSCHEPTGRLDPAANRQWVGRRVRAEVPRCPVRRYDDGAMSLISRRAIFEGLIVNALGAGFAGAQTRVLSKPKPLAKDAVTHDWTAFLGPTHNAISTETRLSRKLPPPLVWEFTKGTGYASPAIAGERLVFLHRLGNEEIVECLHAETGATTLAIPLSDRFRGSLRIQQRPAIESGHRRRASVHGGRARATALPRPGNRETDLETRPGRRSIASVRIFSERRRRP